MAARRNAYAHLSTAERAALDALCVQLERPRSWVLREGLRRLAKALGVTL